MKKQKTKLRRSVTPDEIAELKDFLKELKKFLKELAHEK